MSAPLPEGVFHLLIADDDLAQHPCGSRVVTVCGELVSASSLPPSCYPPGGEVDRDPLYCPACVCAAARWSAEAEQAAGGVR